jgi:hypothetical protein
MKYLPYTIPLALALTLGLASALAALAADKKPDQSDVPAELRVPAGYERVLKTEGLGVQVYDCADGAWKLREPAAEIVDRRGNRTVAIHYLGPTWQSVRDGSKVVGTAKARRDAPNPLHDIPWLLVQATSSVGPGELAVVAYIQRLDTVGGVAPAGPCATGRSTSVPYRATYDFWAPGR